VKVLYLDESGNHGLVRGDTDYPVFVLGGVICDQRYADDVIEPELSRLKRDLFGRSDLILHTADITRNRNGFERLIEPQFRRGFYQALNALMRRLEYEVVACVVRKDARYAQFGLESVDPYLLSLNVLIEQFCFEIGDVAEGGIVVAEKRGPVLDRQLDVAWLNLKVQGTERVQAVEIDKRIRSLETRSKTANVAGLQLADLVVGPIGRHMLGKMSHEAWEIVESKLRRRSGSYWGSGLTVLPR